MVGSSEIIPKPQIEHLCSQGFVVVIPNYRLAPQVTGKEAFGDCEDAYEWAVTDLPKLLGPKHDIQLDAHKVVAMGHSSGGTLALHMASCKLVNAVTAFYPSLFGADESTSGHQPTSVPPFGFMPDFTPSEQDWAVIKPANIQLSEAPFGAPGTVPSPRTKWQMSILKNGQWFASVQPDGDYAAIDPMTRISAQWAPVMIVQGEADNVPGSSLQLARRAKDALESARLKNMKLEVVEGESHMFDLPPTVGTSDKGPKWQAVLKGLDWLKSHV